MTCEFAWPVRQDNACPHESTHITRIQEETVLTFVRKAKAFAFSFATTNALTSDRRLFVPT